MYFCLLHLGMNQLVVRASARVQLQFDLHAVSCMVVLIDLVPGLSRLPTYVRMGLCHARFTNFFAYPSL